MRTPHALQFSNAAQQERDTEGKQAEIITRSYRNNGNMKHWHAGKQESEYPLS